MMNRSKGVKTYEKNNSTLTILNRVVVKGDLDVPYDLSEDELAEYVQDHCDEVKIDWDTARSIDPWSSDACFDDGE